MHNVNGLKSISMDCLLNNLVGDPQSIFFFWGGGSKKFAVQIGIVSYRVDSLLKNK